MQFNPYSDTYQQSPDDQPRRDATDRNDPYIQHIGLIGSLNTVQAILELIASIFLVGLAITFAAMQNNPKLKDLPNAPPTQTMAIFYGVLGVVVGIVAITRLVAGIMILRRQGRLFAIVSNVIGLATVMTGCCALTSLGLCIYTLVVLVQPSVMEELDRTRV